MTPLQDRGAKYVSGRIEGGHPVLTREDGTTEVVESIVIIRGSLVDNGDNTWDIEFPEE